jgi:predicted ATPase
MSRIKIKNFGPVKEGFNENDGWMDIKKVTVFIGNQGSGKSTVAKLISTLTWVEKSLVRGDYDKKWFETKNKLRNKYLNYHRLENYFIDKTEFDYEGDAYHIKYKNDEVEINNTKNRSKLQTFYSANNDEVKINNTKNRGYRLPQIMYVPAERNFISIVKIPKALNLTFDSLIEFVTEFDNAKNEMKGSMKLPINDVEVQYDKLNDVVNIKGKDYKIRLTEASSGFQSLVPLYLVTWYLSNVVNNQKNMRSPISSDKMEKFRRKMRDIIFNEGFTDKQKKIAISELSAKTNNKSFVNIVEEPEQNLFPTSQWQMLKSLLEFNNTTKENKLIMTTHSPYIINYLTLTVKAYNVSKKIETSSNKEELMPKLNKIVPQNSIVNPDDWVVYELDEKDGTIKRLENYKGLPSDDNYLNNGMDTSNEYFANLLEIEDLCQ